MNLWMLIFRAGPVAKLTLFILLLISFGTWAVIFLKWRQLCQAEADLISSAELAERCKNSTELVSKMRSYRKSSAWRVIKEILTEAAKLRAEGLWPKGPGFSLEILMKRLARRLGIAKEKELLVLRTYLPFLAMAGNSSPFIGLFGTVWGIMSAFHHIGLKGSASLATVAPGIAEALVATAMGLFAAIPAAIAYNFFTARLERLEARLQELGELVLLLVEKDLLRELIKPLEDQS